MLSFAVAKASRPLSDAERAYFLRPSVPGCIRFLGFRLLIYLPQEGENDLHQRPECIS